MPRLINGSPHVEVNKVGTDKAFEINRDCSKNTRLETTLHDYQLVFLIDL